jgi:hypothetical protein
MIAKATRDTDRQRGLRARLVTFLGAPFAAARARREAEDARDVARAEEILARNEPGIPHDEVKRRLGMP